MNSKYLVLAITISCFGLRGYSQTLTDSIDCLHTVVSDYSDCIEPGCNFNMEKGNFDGWKMNVKTNRGNYTFDYNQVTGASTGYGTRFRIKSGTGKDPYGNFNIIQPSNGNGTYCAQLGNDNNGSESESLIKTIKITKAEPFLSVKYAVVLQEPGHPASGQPKFTIEIFRSATGSSPLDCNPICCARYEVKAAPNIPGFKNYSPEGIFKDWTIRSFDMSKFMNVNSTYEYFMVKITTYDCAFGGHWAYAYVEGICGSGIDISGTRCYGSLMSFIGPVDQFIGESYYWDFGDGNFSFDKRPSHVYVVPGTYLVKLVIKKNDDFSEINCGYPAPNNSPCYPLALEYNLVITDYCCLLVGRKLDCENCIASFEPIAGEKYILSAWVREDVVNPSSDSRAVSYKRTSGSTPHILINFTGGTFAPVECYPSGPIIDGWQKIEKEFTIPVCSENPVEIKIKLQALSDVTTDFYTYFDDIRVFPKRGGMKSFVYDPITQKLMAELDENNFATLFEYDEEGALIRVKKETERGIKTIKESGNNTQKKQP